MWLLLGNRSQRRGPRHAVSGLGCALLRAACCLARATAPLPPPPPPRRRSDLEKAISAHGGPSQVAAQLGWKQRAKGRRPKGYWDSLDNVRAELDEFIEEQRLPPGVSARCPGRAAGGLARWLVGPA